MLSRFRTLAITAVLDHTQVENALINIIEFGTIYPSKFDELNQARSLTSLMNYSFEKIDYHFRPLLGFV